jgi:hypothetical protein
MTRIRIGTALLLIGFMLAACMSREEKLIDRRHRLRATLDELHETYSGPDHAAGGRGTEAGSNGGVVGRFLAEVNRAQFDEYCLAIGRGERPFALSGKLESFMKTPEHARTCREAAEMQIAVEELERELGRPR